MLYIKFCDIYLRFLCWVNHLFVFSNYNFTLINLKYHRLFHTSLIYLLLTALSKYTICTIKLIYKILCTVKFTLFKCEFHDFSTSAELCNHHHSSILECFYIPQRSLVLICSHSLFSSSDPGTSRHRFASSGHFI